MSLADFKIIVINPGSTSTKLGYFSNDTCLREKTVRHTASEMKQFPDLLSQTGMRVRCVEEFIKENDIDGNSLSAIVGRGGLIRPVESGVYIVNENMLNDLKSPQAQTHASSLGGIIAEQFAKRYGIPAYIADPVVVDELDKKARLSGIPEINRISVFHALNAKAVARQCAADMSKKYEDCRIIVAHMGGGISVSAHKYGRVVDVNDGLNGDGPFTPERSGGVPLFPLIKLCYSGKYSEGEMLSKVTKTGGVLAYLGTNDMRKVAEEAEKDDYTALVLESMAYQVAKEIGAMFIALGGYADAIVLTGGLAYSSKITEMIKKQVEMLSEVRIYPGEDELKALAQGAVRILSKAEAAKIY
ncbi:MAG: butyrate kinase [Lachnospiraceae bacterium]|jgi:butyrate kinase|nr:butyrate kinase [Lachnospiraceae bacterium]